MQYNHRIINERYTGDYMSDYPHWEEGQRVHNYWNESTRYGCVERTEIAYTAAFLAPTGAIEQVFSTLQSAKRWMKRMYTHHYVKGNSNAVE